MPDIEVDKIKTKEISNEIGELSDTKTAKANGTSEVSNDGLTAKYSDLILAVLDGDLKNDFELLMTNSKERFNWISNHFEESDVLVLSED